MSEKKETKQWRNSAPDPIYVSKIEFKDAQIIELKKEIANLEEKISLLSKGFINYPLTENETESSLVSIKNFIDELNNMVCFLSRWTKHINIVYRNFLTDKKDINKINLADFKLFFPEIIVYEFLGHFANVEKFFKLLGIDVDYFKNKSELPDTNYIVFINIILSHIDKLQIDCNFLINTLYQHLIHKDMLFCLFKNFKNLFCIYPIIHLLSLFKTILKKGTIDVDAIKIEISAKGTC